MHIKYIIGLFFCFVLLACQPVALWLYGVKKPKQISTRKIEKKATKLGLDTFEIFSVRVQHYPKLLNEIKSFPNIRIYDQFGNLYNYREDPEACKSTAFNFIEGLRSDSMYPHIKDSSFFRLPLQLEGLHRQAFDLKALPDADFYMVIFWGTFLGKLNKDYVIPWVRVANNNRNAKIHVIPVTFDMCDHWGNDYMKYWRADATSQ